MKQYKVLHVSPTPLVDSPRKISVALDSYTEFESNHFIFTDYPGSIKGIFSNNSLLYSTQKDLIHTLIENADIIHIHNFLYPEQEEIIFNNSKSDTKFVYQAHSPLREGPNFVDYVPKMINFDKRCVVAQYHPRLYSTYTMLPNIVLENPYLNLIKDSEVPKVLFSPAHKRTGGRWNDKYSNELFIALKSLESLDKIEMIVAENYKPFELFQLRKQCHISIDEIVTGAFHQISLESLFAGNVTINNSDIFSKLAMEVTINSREEIPFYKANNHNIKDKLLFLVQNYELMREYQLKSFKFAKTYLQPDKLINLYTNMYKEVLDNV